MHNKISLVKHAEVYYYNNFLTEEESNELFDELNNLKINRHTYNNRLLGRHTAVFGNKELLSNVPPKIWGDNAKIEVFTPILRKVMNKTSDFLGINFNICLVNSYETGKNYIGWHSDNEEKGSKYLIASISLGAERKFSFLYKNRKLGDEPERVVKKLENGSLLVMKHPCQDNYLHSLLQDKKIKSKRINLTFREFHYDN